MINDVNDRGTACDEGDGGDDRSRREPADAADAVTARASVAQPGAEADQQAGEYEQAVWAEDAEVEGMRKNDPERKTSSKQTGKEAGLPDRVAPNRPQNAGQDAADAGDLAVYQ